MTFRTKTRIGQAGFTIVELLVVIVVLSVLFLIVKVAYDGIASRAYDNSIQSDIDHAASDLALYYKNNQEYPSTLDATGFTSSEGNTVQYSLRPYGYCVAASNIDANASYAIRSTNGKIVDGDCALANTYFAGSPYSAAYVDAQGTSAKFGTVQGLARDSQGNVYVSDYGNYRIRKVSPTGDVTTVAGSGSSSCTMGNGTSAAIGRTYGLTVTPDDVLYFLGCNGARVLKYDPATGDVSTFAGGGSTGYCTGSTTAIRYGTSKGLYYDSISDAFYIGSTSQHRICKLTRAGVGTVIAGASSGFLDANGTSAMMNNPWGLTVAEDGTIYFVDSNNRRIRKITPSGDVVTIAGTGASGLTNGAGTVATFYNARDIYLDEATGNLLVPDSNTVRKISLESYAVSHMQKQYDTGGTQTYGGSGEHFITYGDGYLYIFDTTNYRLNRTMM